MSWSQRRTAIQILFTACPDVWDPDVGARIRERLDAGRIVVWRSVSGSALTLANLDGAGRVETYGVRHNARDPLAIDHMPVLLGRIEATSCGLWAPGYRSARPVIACALDDPAEADDVQDVFVARLLELADDPGGPQAWLAVVPPTHPGDACPVNHCALRMRVE